MTALPRPRVVLALAVILFLVAAGVVGAVLRTRTPEQPGRALPLERMGQLALPGDNSRFDYAGLDPGRGLLFIAHLGVSEVIEVDVHANRVVRTISGLPDVHGVLVVPALHRVYVTATGADEMVTLDEDTGAVLHRTPTGAHPDGLAYDPVRGTVWTTNESGGSETVIDAATGTVRGTVDLGGDGGNVAYDPVASGQILADVQSRDELAVVGPVTLAVTHRIPLPGCDHDHGLALAPDDRLAFVACDGNARLLTVDLNTRRIIGTDAVGTDPDVLAYDSAAHRLYVSAESGWLTVLDNRDRHLTVSGRAHLVDGAHVVAVNSTTHRSYYPVPQGSDGHPALVTYRPKR
ncbi:YncE family protein [Streptomyces sp. NBC_00252]|uniref:YncE family protein n=1 Tax=Streptomyces sp. NBC_00252 TaxID=2975691 RepID=UPI002E2E729A|nr:YncE family protein [Streptomyces sp. NBC_00252]